MSGKGFSHPNIGNKIDVELIGRRVVITLHTNDRAAAADVANKIMAGLRKGMLNLTLAGVPTGIAETTDDRH